MKYVLVKSDLVVNLERVEKIYHSIICGGGTHLLELTFVNGMISELVYEGRKCNV